MISLTEIPVIESFDGLNVGKFTGEQFLCFFSDTLRDIAKTKPQTARLITRIGERDKPGAVKEMVRLMLPHFKGGDPSFLAKAKAFVEKDEPFILPLEDCTDEVSSEERCLDR